MFNTFLSVDSVLCQDTFSWFFSTEKAFLRARNCHRTLEHISDHDIFGASDFGFSLRVFMFFFNRSIQQEWHRKSGGSKNQLCARCNNFARVSLCLFCRTFVCSSKSHAEAKIIDFFHDRTEEGSDLHPTSLKKKHWT